VEQKKDTKLTNDPKVLWAMAVWAVYGALWVRHRFLGQTGRRFAWGLIGVFVFVLLTFWGIDLLSPSHKV
jgi:ABC-type transport system involved in cytochrome c biogenesis permease subunit